MRRRAGIGAIRTKDMAQEKYRDKGNTIQENQFEQMTKQMEIFKTKLEEFANKHKDEIKRNPQFRKQFQVMCASIGVDPLASSKTFWAQLGIGTFYHELGIQIIEVCLATNHKNGGIISLNELRQRLIRARGTSKQHQDINNDDLLCATDRLKIFGNGFTVVKVSKNEYMVQSVPGELNMDHTAVIQIAVRLDQAFMSADTLKNHLNWDEERAKKTLIQMTQQGLTWVDHAPNSNTILYWFPSLFKECIQTLDV